MITLVLLGFAADLLRLARPSMCSGQPLAPCGTTRLITPDKRQEYRVDPSPAQRFRRRREGHNDMGAKQITQQCVDWKNEFVWIDLATLHRPIQDPGEFI